jgi:uncharacterized protein
MGYPRILSNEELKELLSEVADRAKEFIGPSLVEIVLFGSYACGKQVDESDVDVLFVIDDTEENVKIYDKKLGDLAFEMLMKYEIFVSLIVTGYNRFIEYSDILPFYMNVEKEGIKLYERTAA